MVPTDSTKQTQAGAKKSERLYYLVRWFKRDAGRAFISWLGRLFGMKPRRKKAESLEAQDDYLTRQSIRVHIHQKDMTYVT